MYIVIYESRDTNHKYTLTYDVMKNQFYLADASHLKIKIEENKLFHVLDELFEREFTHNECALSKS